MAHLFFRFVSQDGPFGDKTDASLLQEGEGRLQ